MVFSPSFIDYHLLAADEPASKAKLFLVTPVFIDDTHMSVVLLKSSGPGVDI